MHVVRKTALNYSERENFQADLRSYATKYGVGKEMYASCYSHSLDTLQPLYGTFAHYLHRMSFAIDRCIV